MRDHIDLLISIADKRHRDKHFILSEIKPGHSNKITRVLFHEFSFYTNGTPLTKKEFEELGSVIEKIASTKSENLYILISSFPVLTTNKEVINMVIHVQCGKTPQLDFITKVTAGIGPEYENTKTSQYSSARSRPIKIETPATPLLPETEGDALNYGNQIITCKTSGGAMFDSAISICLDHRQSVTKLSWEQRSKTLQMDRHEFIPDQFSQIITSNTMDIYPLNKVTGTIVRADPKKSYDESGKIKPDDLPNDITKNITIEFDPNQYQIEAELEQNRIILRNMPYGPDVSITSYPAHKLDHLYEKFPEIQEHNNRVVEDYVNTADRFTHEVSPEISYKKLDEEIPKAEEEKTTVSSLVMPREEDNSLYEELSHLSLKSFSIPTKNKVDIISKKTNPEATKESKVVIEKPTITSVTKAKPTMSGPNIMNEYQFTDKTTSVTAQNVKVASKEEVDKVKPAPTSTATKNNLFPAQHTPHIMNEYQFTDKTTSATAQNVKVASKEEVDKFKPAPTATSTSTATKNNLFPTTQQTPIPSEPYQDFDPIKHLPLVMQYIEDHKRESSMEERLKLLSVISQDEALQKSYQEGNEIELTKLVIEKSKTNRSIFIAVNSDVGRTSFEIRNSKLHCKLQLCYDAGDPMSGIWEENHSEFILPEIEAKKIFHMATTGPKIKPK